MNALTRTLVVVLVLATSPATLPASLQSQNPADAVRAAETAFAASMGRRDVNAFASHVAEDAIFFGGQSPLRGKAAVVAGWRPFFDGPQAPFSWAPETVEVLSSGTLAFSSGPVRDPQGRQTATFNSIWRKDADGQWRVVFDKGCSCPGQAF